MNIHFLKTRKPLPEDLSSLLDYSIFSRAINIVVDVDDDDDNPYPKRSKSPQYIKVSII